MKKNKFFLIFAILTVICVVTTAAIIDQCGCSATPIETEDVEGGEAEKKSPDEEPPEAEPPEEEPPEEEPPEAEPPEEEPPEEEPPEAEPAEAPTIALEIYEGPNYSPSDNVCYYRIKANVAGMPAPSIEFSKDDSNGAWGEDKVQINLSDPADTYNLTATATNSEGTATDSIEISWGCAVENNPPEIADIISAGDHYVGLEYEFTADASDPDGDSLTYSWSVSDGSIANPDINPVKWTMPTSAANYDITVLVDDGNGGTAERTETFEVLDIPSQSLAQVSGGGSIIKDYMAVPQSIASVGDFVTNKPERGYLSFDISSLSGKTVVSAEMKFNSYSENADPYSLIEKIWLEAVYWGNDDIKLADFYLQGVMLGEYDIPTFTCSSQKLVDELNKAIDNGHAKFQVRLRHKGYASDNDNTKDVLSYGPVEFTVYYLP
jgi:hypothetical protein